MATEEIEISQLELADEILADMVTPVETATETKAVTLSQLRKWLGSSLPTGFILPAVGRIEDSRFTLLDGKTLSRTGTYEDFCKKVIDQVNAGNWFSCTQSEYDEDLSKYGQCGRFVIETDYVRIPTITRYIGATITLSEIGKTYAESLPNITGSFEPLSHSNDFPVTGAFYNKGVGNAQADASQNGAVFGFDASKSSSTYQEGAKVNPEHTKYPYYMVISTTGQTAEVGIDINKVYEDLNLKANKDLSDVSQAGKTTAVGWGMPSDNYIDLTLGANLSKYTAPANGYLTLSKQTNGNQFVCLRNVNNGMRIYSGMISNNAVRVFMPVKKGHVVEIEYNAGGALEFFRFVYAEGEI